MCHRSGLEALVTFTFSGVVQAEFYRWQDAEGNTHFTDDLTRVPPQHRDRVHVEALPEDDTNITPAPRPATDTPAQAGAQAATQPVDEYAECMKKVQEERERLTRELEENQDRLVELNKVIRRSTSSRKKNAYQRERVSVKDRIAKAEDMLRERVPPMEEECDTIRYWQYEE